MRSPHRRKKDEPCDNYSGNLCGGFDGEADMTCYACGWQRYEHKSRYPKRPPTKIEKDSA